MEAEKVHLTKEKETLLATLYCRALESRSKDPILRDEAAENVVRRIDYDFRKLKIQRDDPASVALRAKQLDLWTKEFLADRPDATVLHLGCGLDSRANRIDPPASVRWYDIDYPEVIELRRRFYPERDGYRMIASSVTDPQWLDEVPADRPTLIVAEGLMPYLSENDGKQLLERLTARFKSGQLAFDAWSRLAVRLSKLQPTVRATGASMGWGIDDPRELEKWNPRLEFLMEHTFFDAPEIARLSWASRAMCQVIKRIPTLRKLGRLLRYRF